MTLLWLLACAHRDPLPEAPFLDAERRAASRVPDPARGGPPVSPTASPLPPFRGVDRATARYVGPGACAACHADAFAAWPATSHARALVPLAEARRDHDPACLRCHVTGLGHPGGFPSADDLAAVTCEACHGPGSAHVAAPGRGYGTLPKGMAACVACHTHDTSPDFAFDERWPLIAHE